MNFGSDEKPFMKIITSGEETSLEAKVNEYLNENPQQTLASMQVAQTTYHTRIGTTESGMMAVMIMRVKR